MAESGVETTSNRRMVAMALLGSMTAGAVGLCGYALGHGAGEDRADERVLDVQGYYRDIMGQLEAGRKIVVDLTIDDNSRTYTFATRENVDGRVEHCKGSYMLNGKVATATGDIACTFVQRVN